ncbi:hypothetical protein B0H10DRAFT_2186688 [Mycena sp. CBHHK59/15]|nr:hypothetical protein B0H10DRAFT_2186688 [Mycena sp. CBHHK59/15]
MPSMKNHFVQVVDRARQMSSLGRINKRSRSGSVTASQLSCVPMELWLKIFSYLTTPWDIKAATLTCLVFRQLAQPLLFTKICTHPPPPSMALLGTGTQTNKYRRRTSQRLEFFLSPLIAPAVRECWIDPPSPEDDDLPTDVLINAIFDGLRKLPNLKVLGCRSIRLTPKRLAVLQRLTLTTLTLESCPSDLVDFTRLPAVPLSYVTFKYHGPVSQDIILPPLLSLFLSPRHLQRLSATSTDILPVIVRSRPFARLTILEIPIPCLQHDLLIPALTHCPAVERVTLHTLDSEGPLPRADALASLPAEILPNLNFYRGPRNYALLFASGRPMKTVEISVPCKAHRLLRTLGRLNCTLDYVSFRIDGPIPATLLASVHALFPTLRTLSVNDPAVTTGELQTLFAETPPQPAVRLFRIRVEGRDKYHLWIPPMEEAADAMACFKKTLADFERVYPNLLTLKFHYGLEDGAVVWRRSNSSQKFIQVT